MSMTYLGFEKVEHGLRLSDVTLTGAFLTVTLYLKFSSLFCAIYAVCNTNAELV